MTNLASLIDYSARTYPERTAIVFGVQRLSYAQVDAAANQVANLLVARGIEAGDKVALSCPNLPYFTVIYFGILKAGATVVPLNILLKARTIPYTKIGRNVRFTPEQVVQIVKSGERPQLHPPSADISGRGSSRTKL